mgnify:CR=1 FL=1
MDIYETNRLTGGNMKLLKDLWAHLKEWSEWGMKDWIKAGIFAIIVIIILGAI